MDRKMAHKVYVERRTTEHASMYRRIGKLAHKAEAAGASPEQVCRIVEANLGNCEKAHNSNGTVIRHGGLARGARVVQGASKPTCKVRDHKNRKRVRVEYTCMQFAHTVDQQRTYTYKTAPFRRGGSVYEACSSVGKRRLRGVVGLADRIAQKGEITAALEMVLGAR